MDDENPRPYDPSVIAELRKGRADIHRAAAITGVPAEAIAGPIAREMNKTIFDYPLWGPFARAYALMMDDTMPDGEIALAPATHEYLASDHEVVTNNDIRNVGDFAKKYLNRLWHPTLNDVGPGRIQLGTAITLLDNYLGDPSFFGDPLDLAKYGGQYDRLLRDMEHVPDRTAYELAYKLQALMGREGIGFYRKYLGQDPKSGLDRWDLYSPDDQAALLTTYSTRGGKKMREIARDRIRANGSYTPDLANSDGAAYYSYKGNPAYPDNPTLLRRALTPQLPSLPQPPTTTADASGSANADAPGAGAPPADDDVPSQSDADAGSFGMLSGPLFGRYPAARPWPSPYDGDAKFGDDGAGPPDLGSLNPFASSPPTRPSVPPSVLWGRLVPPRSDDPDVSRTAPVPIPGGWSDPPRAAPAGMSYDQKRLAFAQMSQGPMYAALVQQGIRPELALMAVQNPHLLDQMWARQGGGQPDPLKP